MKKWLPWIAVILCIVLLVAIIFGAITFIKMINKTAANNNTSEFLPVETYFSSKWAGFEVSVYDAQAECLVLQKQLDATYEQACEFGEECFEELALGHIDTMQTMKAGCFVSCGVALLQISVNGISSDGRVIYTVYDNGKMTACWKN